MDAVEVTLPGGLEADGSWHRQAWLRPLVGRDEVFLAEQADELPPAARTTALLARCLRRLGPLAPVPTAATRALTVGDREAMLLHLRRLTLGERLSCVLACPDPACGEKLDLDLRVTDLLVPPYPRPAALHEAVVDGEAGESYRVRFRLPTGADQEAAVPLAADDPAAAADFVLRRCVVGLEGPDGNERPADELPPAVAAALQRLMAELDPQAEIVLELTCPACETSFVAPFDAADYLARELARRRGDLYREVHLLAFYYHWRETDILAMTGRKRRLYLELLSEALRAGGSG